MVKPYNKNKRELIYRLCILYKNFNYSMTYKKSAQGFETILTVNLRLKRNRNYTY